MPQISDILANLNTQQRNAVEYNQGPLLVLAGAGTGKTKVLTSKIVYLISNNIINASNILAVTFTNRAASEMEHRINNMINAFGITVGTFHSVAIRMLRSHVASLDNGLRSNFTICNSDDQVRLVRDIMLAQNIDIKKNSPKVIHDIISRWKDQAISYDKLSASDAKSQLAQLARTVYEPYQQAMIDSNSVDFGDLLLYAVKILMNDQDLLAFYQSKFKYILVDEYQDTNPVQYIWLRILASRHQKICCVGDDDQSIYSWRGAEIRNILRFEKDFPTAKVIKLEQNYRSTSHILSAASAVVGNNSSRHKKTLWTQQSSGQKIKIVSCWSDREEARFVVTKVAELIAGGQFGAGDIAILVRAGFQTRMFEEVFISNAMPYQIIGGLRFYERMEIRDVLAYIRLAVNNDDNIALERIINTPKRSIGSATLGKIKEFASSKSLSAFASIKQMTDAGLFKGKTMINLQNFTNLVEYATKAFTSQPAAKVTRALVEDSGYLAALKSEKTEEARSRIENINEMLKAINEFENIEEFIEHSSIVMDNEQLENDYGGKLKLMTLHSAKGLEFDVVFLPGWEEGIFPHQKSLKDENGDGLEEERRIAYVGITRAKQQLFISYAESRYMYGDKITSIASRFINEIPKANYDSLVSTSGINYAGSSHNFSMSSHRHANTQNNNTPASSCIVKSAGSHVRHSTLGKGVVVKQNGDTVEVAFENNGIKKVKADYLV